MNNCNGVEVQKSCEAKKKFHLIVFVVISVGSDGRRCQITTLLESALYRYRSLSLVVCSCLLLDRRYCVKLISQIYLTDCL